MLPFLARLFGREPGHSSKEAAKERLRLVLVHDRTDCSPELLTALKEDLIQAISRYMEIDEENLEVSLERSDESVALIASIPIRNVRRSLQPASR